MTAPAPSAPPAGAAMPPGMVGVAAGAHQPHALYACLLSLRAGSALLDPSSQPSKHFIARHRAATTANR